jgi:mono/diheme cytochrome c family protein
MNKLLIHRKILMVSGVVILLFALLLSGCQAEEPVQPEISLEDLSPIKQGYVQQGLIELISDDLSAPVLPAEPTQADLGAEPYYQICLACHGNWGQGLTDEWRETGFGEDMNCWQSKCHAPNHPPQGFEFPRVIPPLLGKGALSGIANAQQLYQVIYETMPWWAPGSLSKEDALNITAYLMRARGELPKGIVLTEANMSAFSLHVEAPHVVDDKPGGLILILGLSVAMLGYLWTKIAPGDKEDT